MCRFAGALLISAAVLCAALVIPFSLAYHASFPGFEDPPFWAHVAATLADPLLGLGPPREVYGTIGRVFSLAYVLLAVEGGSLLSACPTRHHPASGERS